MARAIMHRCGCVEKQGIWSSICEEHDDVTNRIAELQAEVGRLTEERDSWEAAARKERKSWKKREAAWQERARRENESLQHVIDTNADMTASLRAERDRYREALEKLRGMIPDIEALKRCPHEDPKDCPWAELHEQLEIIDAALRGKGGST